MTIVTTSYIKKGIFFRNPFFKREYDIYGKGYITGGVHTFDKGRTLLSYIHLLLNSKKRINEIKEFIKEDNACGYHLNSIRSPLYFEREVRTLIADTSDYFITATGYNYVDEPVGGRCVREKVKVYMKTDNKKIKILDCCVKESKGQNPSYHYTYPHVVEKCIEYDRFE